jgi:prepilin-type N-terminal cleavage/methylation domain-containing protein
MKISLCHQRERGLTLVELLVVIAVLCIFAATIDFGVPANAKARALRIQCVNNLKQIGLATRVWEGDHGEKYPWSIPGTNGGTMEFVTGPNEWRHFQVMSNELSTPKLVLCPADASRAEAATNFNFFSNSNLSFFIGLDASNSDPQSLLSGDRNITNGIPIRNGILELTTNNPAGWTADMHNKVGNILLSDGSVQQVSQTGLRQTVANSGTVTNHLQMPVLGP